MNRLLGGLAKAVGLYKDKHDWKTDYLLEKSMREKAQKEFDKLYTIMQSTIDLHKSNAERFKEQIEYLQKMADRLMVANGLPPVLQEPEPEKPEEETEADKQEAKIVEGKVERYGG